MEKFDLIVIGAGPGGYTAALRALDYKKHVCIIEKNKVGGTGIMNGVLSSKTMWELSQDYAVAASIDRGFRASGLHVDYKKVRKTVVNAARTKQLQMLSQIESFSNRNSKEGSITLKYGTGSFIDENTVKITAYDNTEEQVYAKNIIIATGSKARKYPGLDLDQKRIIDSDGILNLQEFPERMIIIGSGIIGTEFATIFSSFNQTEVHLLDRTHRVLPFEDSDISGYISDNLEENGVKIHYTANLRTIKKHPDCLEVVLDYEDGHSTVLEVDVALVSIGRVANLQDVNLEKIGVEVNERGYLDIDNNCVLKKHSSDCHIFAVGDITGHVQLVNIAEIQGRHVVEQLYGELSKPLDYSNMSTLMFFRPEVASVGLNEKQAQEQKIPYRAALYCNNLVGRAIAMRSTNGFVKLLISNDGSEKILGMRAAGPQVSALIVSVAHIINQGNSLKEAMKLIHPHPSISEGLQECMRVFKNASIYKPKSFPEYIKVWDWKP